MAFHSLTVSKVDALTEDSVALSFEVPDALRGIFAFRPGQFLTLRAPVGGEDLRRSYSIASAPGDPLTVGVRHVPGGRVSGHLQGLREGDRVEVMPPEGRFVYEEGRRILLLAAGSGITPMMSIAAHALARGAEVTLVYGNRTTGSIMFRSDIEALKDLHLTRFSVIHLLSREVQDVALLNGRIDGEKIAAMTRLGLIDPAGSDGVWICGPEGMIATVSGALEALGVPGARVHAERFTVPGEAPRPRSEVAAAVARRGVEVDIVLDGVARRFAMGEGDESVVDAAARAGIELPYSCKGGMCCTCRCKVTAGSVEMAQNWSLEPWEMAAGYVLACQSRPTSERLALDFDAT